MANGYVRQSSGSIVNGEIIDAADLNNEYNAIAAAFHDTAGHNHDGTTGNGGPIDLNNSVSGELPISSGGTGADNAGDARDNLGLGSISVQDADDVLISGGLIDDTVIGSVVPNTGKFTTLQTTGAATFGASSSVTGNFSVLGGNVQLDNSRGISFKDTGGTYRSVLIYTNANNTILSNNASTGGVIIENNNSTGAIGFATNSTRRINIFSDGKIAVGSEVSSATAALDLTGDAIKVQNTKAPNSNKVSRFMGVDYSGSYPFIGVWMASTVSASHFSGSNLRPDTGFSEGLPRI